MAATSLPRHGLFVEARQVVFIVRRKHFRSAEAPKLSYAHALYDALSGITLKGLRMYLDEGRSLLTIKQLFMRSNWKGKIDHNSHLFRTTIYCGSNFMSKQPIVLFFNNMKEAMRS